MRRAPRNDAFAVQHLKAIRGGRRAARFVPDVAQRNRARPAWGKRSGDGGRRWDGERWISLPKDEIARLLQAGVGAAALGAIPGANQLAAQTAAAFDWKKYKGENIYTAVVKRVTNAYFYHQGLENYHLS